MAPTHRRVCWQMFGCQVALRGPTTVLDAAQVLLSRTAVVTAVTPQQEWQVVRTSGGLELRGAGHLLGRWPSPTEAARAATSAIELWVAEHGPDGVFIHAACVAIDDRAVLLPGPSRAGKSTLAMALIRAGATYLSDEYAVLDAAGRVRSFPRPLRLRTTSPDGAEGWRAVAAEDLGGRTATTSMQVGLIAELRHQPRAALAIRATGRAAATLSLIANAVAARTRPEAVLDAAALAAANATSVTGVRGEADAAAAEIKRRLRDPSVPARFEISRR